MSDTSTASSGVSALYAKGLIISGAFVLGMALLAYVAWRSTKFGAPKRP